MDIPPQVSEISGRFTINLSPTSDSANDHGMSYQSTQHNTQGFALMELLVAVAIIAILASLAVAGIAQSRSKARTIACENNFHQMILAWELYNGDNQERLVSNVHLDLTTGWVRGSVRGLGATNLLNLIDHRQALFAPYIDVASVYHCPADESLETINNIDYLRLRSVSMNQAMGYESYAVWLPSKALARPGQQAFKTYRFSTDIQEPSDRFIFIDESEITINDPAFAVEMPQKDQPARWVDVPATRHGSRGVLAFADGHIEAHKWTDRRTPNDHYNRDSEGNEDWQWLAKRTSQQISRP